MSEERKLILDLLAEGKISAEEANELLEAIEQDTYSKAQEAAEETDAKEKGEGAECCPGPGPGQGPGPKPKAKLELGPDLEGRLGDMAVELEELVSDIPQRVQKALEGVTITKDGRKSTLAEMLRSWGIADIGGVVAEPTFKMGTFEVKDRLPVSVAVTNGTVRFAPNDEGTDIKVSARVSVKNSAREEVQRIASKHIEVFFDPKNGLKVRSLDNRDVNVSLVEVKLPGNLAFDISAQSVNGSVKLEGVSAKSANIRTVNGTLTAADCDLGSLDAQTVNGGVRLSGALRDANASTVNGGIRAAVALVGGNVRLSSSNGSVRAAIDTTRSVPMQIQASSRNGALKMGVEGLETLQEASVYSMHKSGTWRSRGFSEAKVRAELEVETRNGSTVISSGTEAL